MVGYKLKLYIAYVLVRCDVRNNHFAAQRNRVLIFFRVFYSIHTELFISPLLPSPIILVMLKLLVAREISNREKTYRPEKLNEFWSSSSSEFLMAITATCKEKTF